MKNHEKPTWSFTGWLQVIWGDSKEEVIIFRYRTFLLYIDHQPLIKNLSKLMVGLVAVRLDHRVLVRVKVRPDKIIWQQWGKMVTYKNFLSLLVNLFVDQRRRRRRFLSAGWWQYCLCLPRWLATAAAAVVDTRWHWVRAGARQVVMKFKFKVLIR